MLAALRDLRLPELKTLYPPGRNPQDPIPSREKPRPPNLIPSRAARACWQRCRTQCRTHTRHPAPVTRPTLVTRHPTPFALHHTPSTQRPSPNTLPTSLYTIHPQLNTRHPTPYSLNPIPYSLHLTQYTLKPTLFAHRAARECWQRCRTQRRRTGMKLVSQLVW